MGRNGEEWWGMGRSGGEWGVGEERRSYVGIGGREGRGVEQPTSRSDAATRGGEG